MSGSLVMRISCVKKTPTQQTLPRPEELNALKNNVHGHKNPETERSGPGYLMDRGSISYVLFTRCSFDFPKHDCISVDVDLSMEPTTVVSETVREP